MGDLNKDALMNRRRFLQIVGLVSGSMIMAPLLSAAKPVEQPREGRRSRYYRGTQDGKVLGSGNGKDWKVVGNFGPHLAVRDVKAYSDGWVIATLMMGDQLFMLKSQDERTWYTLDYQAPKKG